MSQNNGMFVISLDFELFWGMHDVTTLGSYENNLLGTHRAVRELLKTLGAYDIHATWAIVGMLYFSDVHELKREFPGTIPFYTQKELSAYHYINTHNIENMSKKLFFAPYLINEIMKADNQEIATHTFSHFYTLEQGSSEEAFEADLQKAITTAKNHGHDIKSIVFPRNQINQSLLSSCKDHKITAYRGNEDSFMDKYRKHDRYNYPIRAIRLIDHYMNLSGHQTYKINADEWPLNIRASKFLMPYVKHRKWLEPLKLRRIKRAMTHAAINGEVYHLWWHPHNFGLYLFENIKFLRKVLQHYAYLKETYQFTSLTMGEIAKKFSSNHSLEEEKHDYQLEKVFVHNK